LRESARCGVLLRHRIAVRSVNDARRYRLDAQVSGDQSIRPGRVPTRTPAVVAELEPSGSVARQSAGVEISSEVASAITFVYSVDVLFEHAPCFDGVGCRGVRRG